MRKFTEWMSKYRQEARVVVGKREQGGKPFTEYTGPDGRLVRVWSPSVVKEANRRADIAIDKAMASIREDERRYGS